MGRHSLSPLERRKRIASSVVYFVRAIEVDKLKIGTALKIKKRFDALNSGSPIPLKLIGTIAGGEQVERWCHFHCYQDRSHFEWFNWTDRTRGFVEHVLAHGANAAESLCPKELRADLLTMDGRPEPAGHLYPMPLSRSTYDFVRRLKERVTPLDTCTCELCAMRMAQ